MSFPREAVILAAGLGTRFGGQDDVKQLARLGVLGLIERNVRFMSVAGLERLIVVTGYRNELVEAALRETLAELGPADQAPDRRAPELCFVHNTEYTKKNGISAMLGGGAARGPYLLLMADHVFDPAILRHALQTVAPEAGGVLYVDRKLASIFDMDDATKVRTGSDGQITAIGKALTEYDAVDVGLFVMTADLHQALSDVYLRLGDCSLSDGVQALADRGTMGTRDVGTARWQDVDTVDALEHAVRLFGDVQEP